MCATDLSVWHLSSAAPKSQQKNQYNTNTVNATANVHYAECTSMCNAMRCNPIQYESPFSEIFERENIFAIVLSRENLTFLIFAIFFSSRFRYKVVNKLQHQEMRTHTLDIIAAVLT